MQGELTALIQNPLLRGKVKPHLETSGYGPLTKVQSFPLHSSFGIRQHKQRTPIASCVARCRQATSVEPSTDKFVAFVHIICDFVVADRCMSNQVSRPALQSAPVSASDNRTGWAQKCDTILVLEFPLLLDVHLMDACFHASSVTVATQHWDDSHISFQWRRGNCPTLNFSLQKNVLLVGKFSSKIHNLGLKIGHYRGIQEHNVNLSIHNGLCRKIATFCPSYFVDRRRRCQISDSYSQCKSPQYIFRGPQYILRALMRSRVVSQRCPAVCTYRYVSLYRRLCNVSSQIFVHFDLTTLHADSLWLRKSPLQDCQS